jgi:hypothetical protein
LALTVVKGKYYEVPTPFEDGIKRWPVGKTRTRDLGAHGEVDEDCDRGLAAPVARKMKLFRFTSPLTRACGSADKRRIASSKGSAARLSKSHDRPFSRRGKFENFSCKFRRASRPASPDPERATKHAY